MTRTCKNDTKLRAILCESKDGKNQMSAKLIVCGTQSKTWEETVYISQIYHITSRDFKINYLLVVSGGKKHTLLVICFVAK